MNQNELTCSAYCRSSWLGAPVSTWDFVLSQGSGNAALCIWMIANAVWAGKKRQEELRQ